jgi:hypothetical protein
MCAAVSCATLRLMVDTETGGKVGLEFDTQNIDRLMIGSANLLNLTLAGMMVARVHGPPRLASALGLMAILLAVPVAALAAINAAHGREWWSVVLPSFLVAFMLLTLVLDYGLHSDFRETRALWPYVALYYFSLMMLVGYSFLVDKTSGFMTLGTYYVCVAASIYEYVKLVRPAG